MEDNLEVTTEVMMVDSPLKVETTVVEADLPASVTMIASHGPEMASAMMVEAVRATTFASWDQTVVIAALESTQTTMVSMLGGIATIRIHLHSTPILTMTTTRTALTTVTTVTAT